MPISDALNLDDLTIGEIQLLEDISGLSLTQISNDDKPKARVIQAIVFIVSRKQGNPKTLDEIAAMPISEAETYLSALEAQDPE